MALLPVSDGEAEVRHFISSLRRRGLSVQLGEKEDTIIVRPAGHLSETNDAYIRDTKPIILAVLKLEKEIEARFVPSGYVYVLRAGEYFKIGKAKDLDQRIKQLTIQLPFAVELIHAIECEDHHATERDLHEHFREQRVNGEWFLLEPDQIEELKKVNRT